MARLQGPRARRGCRPAVAALLTVVVTVTATGLPLAPNPPKPTPVRIASVALTGRAAPQGVARTAAGTQADPIAPAGHGWHAEVPLPNAGQMVALQWSGAPMGSVRLRSHNAAGWSSWVDLDGDPTEAPDGPAPGRVTVGPVWVGPGTDRVGLQVETGALTDLQLDALDVEHTASGAGGIATAGAAVGEPGMISRASWGAQPWASSTPGCEGGPQTAKLRDAIVHHTVNTNAYTPDQAFDLVRGIQAEHININGWCDIAYNFLVDRFGRVFEGRAGGADQPVIGGHARGFNTGSVGIALLGQYQPGASPTSDGVSVAQRSTLRDVIAWKFALGGIDARDTISVTSLCDGSGCKYPSGQAVTLPTILGHRDVSLTACPGDNAMAWLPWLRTEVANIVIHGGPFFPLPGWTPASSGRSVLTLDAWGGVHPGGRAAAVPSDGYWPDWSIARAIAGRPDAAYVLDGWGGVHTVGAAPRPSGGAYWPGWDIARSLALVPGSWAGDVLDGFGGLHPIDGARTMTGGPYWPGWDIARDLALTPSGRGGYVLDGWGGVHPFGDAPAPSGGPYWRGWDIARAIALNPDGPGGWVLDGFGGVWPWGGAPALAITRYAGADVMRDLVVLPGGGGYIVDVGGHVWPIGNAAPIAPSLTWSGYSIGRGIVAG
jgi:hypothetical protein